MTTGLRVEPYHDSMAEDWDAFVWHESGNGTLWHTRRFLSYHPPERFQDASVLVYDGDLLVCVLPACRDGEGAFSHKGSTAGGPVVRGDWIRTRYLLRLAGALLEHYEGRLTTRLPESIFAPDALDPLLYVLGRDGRISVEMGVYRDLRQVDDLLAGVSRSRTRSNIRKALRDGLEIRLAETEDEYIAFHGLLAENLEKHGTEPTHSLEEMLTLRRLLSDRQLLLLGLDGERVVAGTWVQKATGRAWHTFYIAKDYDAGHGVMPAVLVEAMRVAKEAGADYLNFGICTEDGGLTANEGLFDFKESLGGTTVNRYTIRPG